MGKLNLTILLGTVDELTTPLKSMNKVLVCCQLIIFLL